MCAVAQACPPTPMCPNSTVPSPHPQIYSITSYITAVLRRSSRWIHISKNFHRPRTHLSHWFTLVWASRIINYIQMTRVHQHQPLLYTGCKIADITAHAATSFPSSTAYNAVPHLSFSSG